MAISQFIKRSTLKAAILSLASISGLTLNTTASHAVQIDLRTDFASEIGDVVTPGLGQVRLSTDSIFSRSGPAPAAELANLLGIAANALNLRGNAVEGSAIQLPFLAEAGDVLSFDFNVLSNEDPGDNLDYAFVQLDDFIIPLAQASNPSNIFTNESGVNSFRFAFAEPGIYNIGFGVLDTVDGQVPSALLVSNLDTTAEPVPEPLTILGSLTALGLGAAMRQRFQKKA
jgi:hypothetical protein